MDGRAYLNRRVRYFLFWNEFKDECYNPSHKSKCNTYEPLLDGQTVKGVTGKGYATECDYYNLEDKNHYHYNNEKETIKYIY